MRNKWFIILELILMITAIIFAVLWINYPNRNYEPFTVVPGFFSGVLEILRRLFKKEKDIKPEVPTLEKTNVSIPDVLNKNISSITVKEIVESINNSAPFLKDEMSIKYNGIRVKWTGYLKSATCVGTDKVMVNLNVQQNEIIGKSFWFTEEIEKIPEIKTLPKDSKICVLGDIISASGPGISVTLNPIYIKIIRDIE